MNQHCTKINKTKSSKLQNYTIFYHNSEEYHHLKREIFTQDLYHFELEPKNPEADNPTILAKPVIIDVGAHIGLSTLYFKQLYPASKIIAIEPNPESFKLLEKNIFENQIENVTLVQAALSDHSGQETLYFDETDEKWHSVASFHKGSWVGSQQSDQAVVQTHTLSEFITQPVDFLKMDAEASEQKILEAGANSLPLIKQMAIEFHTHKSQSLPKLVELLEKTHKVELYRGTQEISIKTAKGLVLIIANRK